MWIGCITSWLHILVRWHLAFPSWLTLASTIINKCLAWIARIYLGLQIRDSECWALPAWISIVLHTMVCQHTVWPACITFGHHPMVNRCQKWSSSFDFVLHTKVCRRLMCIANIVCSVHTFICRCQIWHVCIICSLKISMNILWPTA